jgi:hypothetical protein
MGMFDNIICEYPLPGNPAVSEWQTKDTPTQYLDTYIIAADGQLWHEVYDVEDKSDPNATGWRRAAGCMTRVNQRREPVSDFRGSIDFYGDDAAGVWWEFSALFDDGKLLNMKKLSPA